MVSDSPPPSASPAKKNGEFPTVCEVCGKGTGSRSYYTHRALQHPELVPQMDWRKDIKQKKKKKR